MLRTLDLFSGIGGITHALRGFAHPVMYCEKDPKCLEQLNTLIKCGKLPPARIHTDVATLSASAVKSKVDMIVAGSPCIGFSCVGLREGLSHPGSSLFRHIIRLANELRPTFLFLENVEGILANKDIDEVVKSIHGAGYNMWWVVMPAFSVGAKQKRSRWFCLAVRRDRKTSSMALGTTGPYTRFDWSREKVARMTPITPDNVRRMRMLGNSVVPDCVRAAFLSLWTGCTVDIKDLLTGTRRNVPFTPPKPLGELRDSHSAAFACVVSTTNGPPPKVMRIAQPPGMLGKPNVGIVLVPGAYSPKQLPTKHQKEMRTSPLIRKPLPLNMWSTPRAGNGTYAMNVLTTRGTRDLGTQLRFDKQTPSSQRGGGTNPEWGEWLMGFPRGWTAKKCKTTAA